jgi:hypothetical protein
MQSLHNSEVERVKYNLSIATFADVQPIMSFIQQYWGAKHILATNVDVFLFQYQNQLDKQQINVVVAKDSEGVIKAILGFIPSQLQNQNSDIFAALWKVADDVKSPMLGLKLLNYLRKQTEYGLFTTLGLNETSSSIYRLMKYEVDYMQHFVMLNPSIVDYQIAHVSETNKEALLTRNTALLTTSNNALTVKVLTDPSTIDDFVFSDNMSPKKDLDYLHFRYFNHPVYSYKVLAIMNEQQVVAFWVAREQVLNDRQCLRLVDYFGTDSSIADCALSLNEFVINSDYEYLDFICMGMDSHSLVKAGFTAVNQDSDDLIIPDYFSPYLQKNIKMLYSIDRNIDFPIRLFKGDGDQDRPS